MPSARISASSAGRRPPSPAITQWRSGRALRARAAARSSASWSFAASSAATFTASGVPSGRPSFVRIPRCAVAARRTSSGSMPDGITRISAAGTPAATSTPLTASEMTMTRSAWNRALRDRTGNTTRCVATTRRTDPTPSHARQRRAHTARRSAWPSARLLGGGPEHSPQLGQRERLVEVGAAEALEEAEGIATHRVTGREDDALGSVGVLARQLVVHLSTAEVGHPQVADDDVERLRQGALERVLAVARHLDRVPPALERGAHVVQDVGLVVHDEDPQLAGRGPGLRGVLGRRGGRRGGRQPRGERGARARLRFEREPPAVLLQDTLADREAQPGALALGLCREEGLEYAPPDLVRDAGAAVRN